LELDDAFPPSVAGDGASAPPGTRDFVDRRTVADSRSAEAGDPQAFPIVERQGEMRAALRRKECVDLVHNHRVDRSQRIAARDVSSRYSDSGVVIRMSDG
jgi:hypothetical protein